MRIFAIIYTKRRRAVNCLLDGLLRLRPLRAQRILPPHTPAFTDSKITEHANNHNQIDLINFNVELVVTISLARTK